MKTKKQEQSDVKQNVEHTPTLGESLDHYGEEYCTRAVNEYEALKAENDRLLNVHEELVRALKAVAISLINDEHYQEFKPLLRTVEDALAKAESESY